MKDKSGKILYVGKAGNLRRRVASYFIRPHDFRIERLVREIKKIGFQKTDTAIEAFILEAKLIKKYSPPFNVREKDDKSFLYVEFTKEKFPRVLLVRGKELLWKRPAPLPTERQDSRPGRKPEQRRAPFGAGFSAGPFTSASNIRQALKILRKIFPYSTHLANEKAYPSEGRQSSVVSRACFDYQIGLCPGTCVGAIDRKEYMKNIRNLKLFFEGKKKRLIRILEKEMHAASKKLEFEMAAKLKGKLFALQHIQDVALIIENGLRVSGVRQNVRIEGYDISNISGTSAVGSMVVFANDKPDKNEYRKFKIRTIKESNDVGMLKEVLRRRFHNDWQLPDAILIDGGVGQVNGARAVLNEVGLRIPVVGIAKGATRKKNEFIGAIPSGTDPKILIKVRDEAHRFAISYHKNLRGRMFFGDK